MDELKKNGWAWNKLGLSLLSVGCVLVLMGCRPETAPAPVPTSVVASLTQTTLVVGAPMAPTNNGAILRYEGQPTGSKVRMEGDSTIHKWHAESAVVSGSMEFDKSFALDTLKPGPISTKVEAVIPVRTLKSSSGRPMDNVMYNAMAVTNFSKIEFRLSSLECKDSKSPAKFEAKGNLVVMGTTNPVTLAVTIEAPEKDKLLVKTIDKVKMKMSDYKIKAPVLNIGVMKIVTDDTVEISLEWLTGVTGAK